MGSRDMGQIDTPSPSKVCSGLSDTANRRNTDSGLGVHRRETDTGRVRYGHSVLNRVLNDSGRVRYGHSVLNRVLNDSGRVRRGHSRSLHTLATYGFCHTVLTNTVTSGTSTIATVDDGDDK
jgi:hypothetical protein